MRWNRGALEARIARLEGKRAESEASETTRTGIGSLWTDRFGAVATRSLQIIVVLVLVAGVLWGIQTLSTVFIPVTLALIFASTFWPVTRALRARRMPHALIAAIELIAILLILVGVGWLITWAVRGEWRNLVASAESGFVQLLAWLRTLPFHIDTGQLLEWRDQLISWGSGYVTSASFGSGALAGVGALANFITGLILMIVVLFFFLKDGPEIWRFLLRPFTGQSLERAERIGKKTIDTLGSYVRGTASVAFVDAVGIGIGLVILQVPLALPLAVLVFLLSFIPLVGATLAGVLGALVALVANGPLSAVLVIAVVVLVNQLEGNFLQPVLMGRAMKLHALVILLALAAGTVLSGILGAILAVPITAVVWGIIQVWDGQDLPAKWARPQAAKG